MDLVALLRDLTKGAFYGEVSLKFENGKLVSAKKTESIKVSR